MFRLIMDRAPPDFNSILDRHQTEYPDLISVYFQKGAPRILILGAFLFVLRLRGRYPGS